MTLRGDCMDVANWLKQHGFEQYIEMFDHHGIDDLELLRSLTSEDLKEMGVTLLGQRKRLLTTIETLSVPDTTSVDDVAPAQGAEQKSGGEWRQVTVMYCDMVGSTALSVELHPEDLGDLLNEFRECCEDVIRQFDGHVARYMGDGLLIYFGFPRAHEGDPERAVRAALEIFAQLRRCSDRPGPALRAHIGIATGLVVVGELIGTGTAREQTVVGETPNLAARLVELARADEVVIAPETRHQTAGLFEYADAGRHRLKGFSEPVQAWRVLGTRTVESRFEAAHEVDELTPLVGRDEELDILLRRWRQAVSGEGQVVLLTGEPGIGKSRLSQALHQRLEHERCTSIRYYCSPYHQNSTLFPMIDKIERAAQLTTEDSPLRKLQKLEALVETELMQSGDAVPLLAELCSIPLQGRYAPLNLSPQAQRERTLSVLEASIIAIAGQGPLLIIFEDLHWVDATTLELLERLIDRLRELSVLLVMSARPQFEAPWSGEAHVSTIDLRRLSSKHTADLAAHVMAHRTLPGSLLEQIVAKTDGVPLFIEELTKSVLEASTEDPAISRTQPDDQAPFRDVPNTLRDSLMARLDRLGPVMEVAQVGAALGRVFSYEMLAALVPMGGQALQNVLERLTDAGLIHRRGEPPQSTYTFKHALVQDVAHSSMLRSTRQELHKRIARHLEDHYPAQVEREPELLARHYSRARETAPAIGYFLRAARSNARRSAYPEAMSNAMEGLALLQRQPEGPEHSRLEMELQISRAVAVQATQGLAAPETGEAYARARALCDEVGAASDVFPVLHGIYLFHLLRGESDTALEVARGCLRRAEQETSTLFQVIGHRLVGSSLYVRGDLREARDQLQQALERYDPSDHATEEVVGLYGVDQKTIALAHSALVLFLMGYPESAKRAARDSVAHAEGLNSSHNLGYALFWYNMLELLWRHPVDVPERAERLRALGVRNRQPTWTSLGTYQCGAAREALGARGEGVEQINEGLAGWRAIGCGWLAPTMLASLAMANARMGERSDALRTLGEAQILTDQTHQLWYEPELHRLTGELLVQAGGVESERQAERYFEKGVGLAKRQQAKIWELRCATSLARLWRKQDKKDAATELLNPLVGWFSEGHDLPEWQDARRLVAGANGH